MLDISTKLMTNFSIGMMFSKFFFLLINSFNVIARKVYERYYKSYIIGHAKRCEKDIGIYGRPYIIIGKNATVCIGKGFVCRSGADQAIDNSVCSKLIVVDNAKLTIGDYTGISNTTIECNSEVFIGNNVNIGAGTMVFDTDFHSLDWRDRYERKNDIINKKIMPIHIGNCVFIGARSIICKGVTIGDKSIIAAGSVVVKSIPPNEIWGGNPARFIRKVI